MYFFELIEEEKDLKIDIEHIERSIRLLENGYDAECLSHNNLDDAIVDLSLCKNRLKEVHKKIREFITGVVVL